MFVICDNVLWALCAYGRGLASWPPFVLSLSTVLFVTAITAVNDIRILVVDN